MDLSSYLLKNTVSPIYKQVSSAETRIDDFVFDDEGVSDAKLNLDDKLCTLPQQ